MISSPTGILSRIKEHWLNLSASHRRMASFAIIILIVAVAYTMAVPERKTRDKSGQKPQFSFQAPDMAAEVMAEKLQANIQSQKSELQRVQQQIQDLESRLRKQQPSSASIPGPTKSGSSTKPGSGINEDAFMREMNRNLGSTEILPAGETPYAPPPILQIPTPDEQATPAPSAQEATAEPARQGQPAGRPISQQQGEAPAPRSMGVLSWPQQIKSDAETQPAKKEYEGFYMPSASFFEVSLLTGLDAPTGAKAKNQPSPLALRIQDLSWLPNEYRQSIRGCFVLAEGIGELSTERVNIRGISISCVNHDGEQVLDQKLLGFVADSDGKAGMRGEVVSKAGKLLAEGMKVGFIQGLSEFFQFNARSLTVTDSGALSSPKSDDLGNAFLGGASSGIGKALDRVANYYMSLAEEIFPVIQVGATRSATFIVTQGTDLTFDKSLTRGKKDNAHDL